MSMKPRFRTLIELDGQLEEVPNPSVSEMMDRLEAAKTISMAFKMNEEHVLTAIWGCADDAHAFMGIISCYLNLDSKIVGSYLKIESQHLQAKVLIELAVPRPPTHHVCKWHTTISKRIND